MPNRYAMLFVCTGNICRSPTAEGVMRKMLQNAGLSAEVEVDSAGTIDYHAGEAPDERAQNHARRRGYDLSSLRARQICSRDFQYFDLILAMDHSHLAILNRQCPEEFRSRLHLLLDFSAHKSSREVPDPYYGGASGFEDVLDLIEQACGGLLEHAQEQLTIA